MADNNKNPRRTIWLSETEPLSHYDIWLSKNQHLNSDGEPVLDSGVLRDCDYIFKVWDCDNWHPIVGLNSTALNKINTVLNTGYTTTHDGHDINSSSYLEFHLPLFTSPNSSPQELFDAGTIGDAILEYVTELEWYKIFEGDAFSNAFELYIEEGDTNINLLVGPAESNTLGGIWANEFLITDMFPSSIVIPSQPLIDNSYNWLALAKYKYNHGTSDYNLYVNAKDIIKMITEYQEDNPDEPGITPGGGATIDPEVIYRSFFNSPTVLKGWRDDPLAAWKPRFMLPGLNIPENRGKFLMLRQDDDATHNWWANHTDDYDDTNTAVIWQSAHDIVIEGTNYTGNTKKYLSCLNGTFGWETNIGNTYYGSNTIYINPNNMISIAPYLGGLGEVYLCSRNGNVSWQSIDTGTTYILGVGISINNTNNTININTNNAEEGLVLSYDGHGDVEWRNVQSGLTYTAGVGIQIGQNDINSEIEISQETYTALSSIKFNCVFGTSDNPVNGINMLIDDAFVCRLKPFSYIKINTEKLLSGTVTFNIITSSGTSIDLKSVMKGDPVFIELELGEWTDVTFNCPGTYIDSNGVLSANEDAFEEKHVLATLQFGITKLEAIHTQSPQEP